LRGRNTNFNTASQVRIALWVYALLVGLVTAASWAIYECHTVFYLRPLFTVDERFCDLTNFIGLVAHLRGEAAAMGSGDPALGYPAPAAFVYKILIYSFPGHAVRTYLVFLAICISCFAVVAWRAARAGRAVMDSAATAIIVTAVLGYPLWFCADRGNIEGVVWALAAAGLCFLLRGRPLAAAVLIGIAASIKPFCIVFLFLLVGRRKVKDAAFGLATAAFLVIAALTAIGPNPWKAYQELQPGISLYRDWYIMDLRPPDEMRFNHSLLDGMKSAALTVEMGGIHPIKAIAEIEKLRDEPGGWHGVRPLVHVYPFITIAGLGLLFVVFYRMPILNQLTALAVAVTLFPPLAGDYTLLHLYVPFAALLVFLTREVAVGKAAFPYSSMLALAVIYALLFSPLTLLTIYAGDAKLLLLLALLIVAARSPMPSAYFGDPANQDATRTNP